MGLEKVYVQAKRWQENVGRPSLQAFYGALAGQKARKGVFITTSAYTQQAVDFAKSVDGMVLIDGIRLAGLMIDYELGVTARTVKIPTIATTTITSIRVKPLRCMRFIKSLSCHSNALCSWAQVSPQLAAQTRVLGNTHLTQCTVRQVRRIKTSCC